MKNITGVPIVTTGIEYPASTGPVTFTAEDLIDIVESQSDPAIVSPRLKLGHTDPRFNSLDGEPAFGIADNVRLSVDGQTVLCDYVGVPDWLADVMPTAYPNRSIEGNWDVETVTGHKYRFVMSAVALLGVIWPGVSTLDDLEIALSDSGPEGVTVEASEVLAETVSNTPWSNFTNADYDDTQYARACVYDRAKCNDSWKDKTAKQRYSLPVREPSGTLNRNGVHSAAGYVGQVSGGCTAAKQAAATTLVNMYKNQLKEDPPDSLVNIAGSLAASVNLEDVRRSFYDDYATQDEGRYWWWVRAVLLDPNELIVDDDEGGLYRVPFTLSGDEAAFADPIPVKIEYVDAPVAASALAAVHERSAVFASSNESRPVARQKEVNMTTATVDGTLLRRSLGLSEDATEDEVNAALAAAAETQEGGEESGEEGGEEGGNGNGNGEEEGGEESGGETQASGAVLVDAAALAQLQANATLGVQAYARQQASDRDVFLMAAVNAGKFPPARLKHWTEAWDKDPEGIKAAIDSMPEGLIPVVARGSAGGTEASAGGGEAYPASWLPELHRQHQNTITQES
jgi:hypothetical protein